MKKLILIFLVSFFGFCSENSSNSIAESIYSLIIDSEYAVYKDQLQIAANVWQLPITIEISETERDYNVYIVEENCSNEKLPDYFKKNCVFVFDEICGVTAYSPKTIYSRKIDVLIRKSALTKEHPICRYSPAAEHEIGHYLGFSFLHNSTGIMSAYPFVHEPAQEELSKVHSFYSFPTESLVFYYGLDHYVSGPPFVLYLIK